MTPEVETLGEVTRLLDATERAKALPSKHAEPRQFAELALASCDAAAQVQVVRIYLYEEDLAQLDAMVQTLKARGDSRANRSALIRHALTQVDLDKVPRQR